MNIKKFVLIMAILAAFAYPIMMMASHLTSVREFCLMVRVLFSHLSGAVQSVLGFVMAVIQVLIMIDSAVQKTDVLRNKLSKTLAPKKEKAEETAAAVATSASSSPSSAVKAPVSPAASKPAVTAVIVAQAATA